MAEVVACLGSSSTAGQGQAFGWIDELSRRPENARFSFRNLGVGGDFAYDALQRVPAVIEAHPARIVVLIGANDVMAMVFPNVMRLLGGFMKRLPRQPSVEWFRENLDAIVTRLKIPHAFAPNAPIRRLDPLASRDGPHDEVRLPALDHRLR
jgi:lysophospholipase L1-like esterase